MKLIKLMDNYITPLKETVDSVFPRDLEKTLASKYILVSDFLFEKLRDAKVKMFVYNTIIDSSVKNVVDLSKNDYYIVKDVLDPKTFDPDTYTIPKGYVLNDVVFVHADEPAAPVPPVKPKFHSGMFNYELTEADKKRLMDEYEAKYAEYEAEYEAYLKEYETFKTEVMSLPSYNAIGMIVTPTTYVSEYPIDLYNDSVNKFKITGSMKLEIIASAKPQTTKDSEQFNIDGKLPKEMPTLVSEDIGGLKSGTSLIGWKTKEIIEKLFGLQYEKEKIGRIQPDEETDPITITVDYGEGKAAIGSLTDSATVTATIRLPEDSKATTIKIMQGDTVVETKEIAETITFTVTGISSKTKYQILAVYTNSETGEEVITNKATVTIKVKFIAPTLGSLHINPSMVDDPLTPVEFHITVNEGSAPITSVKLYTAADVEVGDMTPINLNNNVYGYTLNSVTETNSYYVKVVDANRSEKKSNNAKVTLTIDGPDGTLAVSNESLQTINNITINATATAGSAEITKIEFFVDNVLTDTITENFTPENLTWEDENVEATTEYKIVITDANTLTKTLTKTVTFIVENPAVTLSIDPTDIATKTADVVLTIQATKNSFDLSKIEIFDGDTLIETYTTSLDTEKTYTITGVKEAKTFNIKVTDVKNNEGTDSKSVSYSYVAPALTVTSVTPTSSDDPIKPSSDITVTVVCTAQTGATGSTIKLYRVSGDSDALLESKSYAETSTFTVSGGHTNGDKFKAVVTYESDGDSRTAQKTSSAITVEIPLAQIYFGDYNEYYSTQPDYNYDADNGLTNENITDTASAYFIAHAAKHINSNQTFTTKTEENTYDMIISKPNVTGTWAVAIPNTVNMRIYETGFNSDATDNILTVRGTYTDPDGITYKIYASENYTDTGSHDVFYLISA